MLNKLKSVTSATMSIDRWMQNQNVSHVKTEKTTSQKRHNYNLELCSTYRAFGT